MILFKLFQAQPEIAMRNTFCMLMYTLRYNGCLNQPRTFHYGPLTFNTLRNAIYQPKLPRFKLMLQSQGFNYGPRRFIPLHIDSNCIFVCPAIIKLFIQALDWSKRLVFYFCGVHRKCPQENIVRTLQYFARTTLGVYYQAWTNIDVYKASRQKEELFN